MSGTLAGKVAGRLAAIGAGCCRRARCANKTATIPRLPIVAISQRPHRRRVESDVLLAVTVWLARDFGLEASIDPVSGARGWARTRAVSVEVSSSLFGAASASAFAKAPPSAKRSSGFIASAFSSTLAMAAGISPSGIAAARARFSVSISFAAS